MKGNLSLVELCSRPLGYRSTHLTIDGDELLLKSGGKENRRKSRRASIKLEEREHVDRKDSCEEGRSGTGGLRALNIYIDVNLINGIAMNN